MILSKSVVARILITSGPTRQYLDPVRYLTNASSGRMGRALAEAALALGHEVVDRQRAGRGRLSGRARASCRSFRPKRCSPPRPHGIRDAATA